MIGAVRCTDMDYWKPATAELKTVVAALEKVHGLTGIERTFIEHASLFGHGKPIQDYPQWSNALGTLRDDMLRSGGNPLIAKIGNMLTELIWRWEYGAMEEVGYRHSLELSQLARTLHEAI